MPPAKPLMKNANPSGPSAAQRKMFAKMGIAMPDGSYYIRNAADLANAIPAVGRGEAAGDSGNAIRVHIMKRAKALGLSSKIPDTWNPDGSLKQAAAHMLPLPSDEPVDVDDFLEHFGIKGMKWGVRKEKAPAAEDASRASTLHTQVKKSGTASLSNKDLQTLVTRMNLESQYKNLSGKNTSAGKKFVDDLIGEAQNEAGKQAKSAVSSATAKVAVAVGAAVAAEVARQTVKGKHA